MEILIKNCAALTFAFPGELRDAVRQTADFFRGNPAHLPKMPVAEERIMDLMQAHPEVRDCVCACLAFATYSHPDLL
ncbi:MAG: hypothetical protein ACKVQA_26425 [Burkholderiales bacterium]